MITAFLAATLFIAQPAAAPASTHANNAPPITLTIDGVPHPLQPGQTTTITIDGQPHDVRIDLPTITRYSNKHITFDYPASFNAGPRQDLGDGVFITQITGQPAVSVIYEFNSALPMQSLFDNVVAQYEGEEFARQVGDASIDANIATLQGRYVQVSVADGYLRQEFYRISNGTEAVFIMIQDVRDNPGQPTPSFTALRQSIAKTLKTN